MDVQIDSREKPHAIKKIIEEFDRQGVNYFRSKLYSGDYMSLDNPRLVIDRKQDISEIHQNVCQGHERLKREMIRAREAGIKIVFLIEHGEDIRCLEDLIFFRQPAQVRYKWTTRTENGVQKKARVPYTQKEIVGSSLYKSFCTIQERYGCRFEFCTKDETGKRILEILRDG